MTTIDAQAVHELRGPFRGALLRPEEEGHDEARRIWNGAIDRRPALVARCAGADDVVEVTRFARESRHMRRATSRVSFLMCPFVSGR